MPKARQTIVTAILAAGKGSRFGGGKLLAPLGGRPLISWPVEAALAAGLGPVMVVTGFQAGEVEAVLPAGAGIAVVENPRPHDGMAGSLVLAATKAKDMRAEVLAVMLGDMPFVRPEVVKRVALAALGSPSGLAAASVDGDRSHPVAFSRRHFDELETLTGDRGAREIMNRLADQTVFIPAETMSAMDVDKPSDLARAGERLNFEPDRIHKGI